MDPCDGMGNMMGDGRSMMGWRLIYGAIPWMWRKGETWRCRPITFDVLHHSGCGIMRRDALESRALTPGIACSLQLSLG